MIAEIPRGDHEFVRQIRGENPANLMIVAGGYRPGYASGHEVGRRGR
jgi:hypothetical protein